MRRSKFILVATFALMVASARAGAESSDIKSLLDDGKPDSVQRALTAIHGLNAREAIDGLRGGWMSRLLDRDRNQDVVDLCEHLAQRAPYYTADLGFLISSRARALLAAGQIELALIEAKRFYFVATMQETEAALRLLAECLVAAHPGDEAMIKKFQQQQVQGYEQAGVRCDVLDQIELPAGAYDDPPDSSDASNDTLRLAAGNRWLLAGKPSEAKAAFEHAAAKMQTDAGRWQAHAGVARAIKAQDGTVARANQYLRERLSEQTRSLGAIGQRSIRPARMDTKPTAAQRRGAAAVARASSLHYFNPPEI